MKLSTVLFFVVFSSTMSAQYGLSIKYSNNDFNTWNAIANELFQNTPDIYSRSYEIGVDYWFRYKTKRLEFFPELSFSNYQSTDFTGNIFSDEDFQYNMRQYGLDLNMHIYIFDFEGDCDCPTWSKQGTFFSKGLFLLVSPGYRFLQHSAALSSPLMNESYTANSSGFKIGIGLGLDIGLSDFITITPFGVFNYYPRLSSTFFDTTNARNCPTCNLSPLDSGALNQIQVGIRLGFRPDYKGY